MSIKDLIPRVGKGREDTRLQRRDDDPFRQFQSEMNRLFDDFFGEFGLEPSWARGERGGGLAAFSPRVDVTESAKEVAISAELPGLDEKDVTVEVDDTAVTIRGEKKEERETKEKNWTRREQSYGSFHRVVPLPVAVDGSKAKARFKKGVLNVTLPKREERAARRKTVEIEAS